MLVLRPDGQLFSLAEVEKTCVRVAAIAIGRGSRGRMMSARRRVRSEVDVHRLTFGGDGACAPVQICRAGTALALAAHSASAQAASPFMFLRVASA